MYSTGARPRPLSASYQHRPSFSLPPGAGLEALFATATTAEGEEGNLATAATTRRTNLDLDQDVRGERERVGGRKREWEGERDYDRNGLCRRCSLMLR